jgi:hypothetical protein
MTGSSKRVALLQACCGAIGKFDVKPQLPFILLLAWTTSALPSSAMTWQEKCEAMAQIATKVMTAHQERVPLSETLHAYDHIESPDFKAILKRIILDAYSGPRFATPKIQKDAVQDFSDRTLVSCLKAE